MEFTKRDTKFIKGVAICLMLYHHLFAFPERVTEGVFISLWSFNDTNLSVCLGAFGRICVPLFTLMSGYGCYLSSLRGGDTGALVRRHIWGLYKTFWMVFAVCLPVLVYKWRAMRSLLAYEVIYNFLGLSTSFNDEWWFVLPFAVLLALFPAIKRFVERKNAALYTDLFLVAVLNTVIVYIIPAVMEQPVFSMLSQTVFWARVEELLEILPAYVTGCILARYDVLSRVKTRFGGQPLWCCAALAGMLAIFFVRPYNHEYYDFVNAAVFAVLFAVLLPAKPMQLAGKVFEKLGEESAMMWLTHTFFCYYWLQRLVYLPRYSPLIFLWLTALSYGSAKLIRLIYRLIARIFASRGAKSAAGV
ncbi:MAG: acyltransferase [Eubacteriales bacterium]|nr:acyltransferase [Eubacteriales bacterium]